MNIFGEQINLFIHNRFEIIKATDVGVSALFPSYNVLVKELYLKIAVSLS